MYFTFLKIDYVSEHYIFIVRLCVCHCHILQATWLDFTLHYNLHESRSVYANSYIYNAANELSAMLVRRLGIGYSSCCVTIQTPVCLKNHLKPSCSNEDSLLP